MSEDINDIFSTLLASINEKDGQNDFNDFLKSLNLSNISSKQSSSDNEYKQFAEDIDIEQLLKLMQYINPENIKRDPRYRLLSALRPYMSNNKKQIFDKYSKYIGFLRILDEFKK